MLTSKVADSVLSFFTLCSALLFVSWHGPEAQAASTFSAHSIGLFQAGGVDQDSAIASTPVTVASTVNNSNGQLKAESVTERGFLTISGFVNGATSKGTSGTLGMFIEFQDVTIRRIDGTPSSDSVQAVFQYYTTLNAAWSGPVPPSSALSSAELNAIAQITQDSASFSENDVYHKDYFSGDTGSPGPESVAATLQADVPFTLRLTIFTGALSARTGNFGQYDMSINVGASGLPSQFEVTSFADSPVFLLPEGFTVDSPEMNLFNNQWQAVPEPSTLALATAGILALTLVTRRRLTSR